MASLTEAKILERFDVSSALASEVSLKLTLASANPSTRLLGAAIDKGGRVYYYIDQLGSGTFGEVYSASLDGSRVPQFVVKEFKFDEPEADEDDDNPPRGSDLELSGAIRHDEYEFSDDYVEREYVIAGVIKRRLGEQFCEENVVCALDRFYGRRNSRRGYIIFPYASKMTLERYLALYVHNRMRAWRKYVHDTGIPATNVADLRLLATAGGPLASAAQHAIRDLWSIQLVCIRLARQCITTLALLHQAFIFHNDIKPDNVIVNGDRPLFIDLGIACVGESPRDAIYLQKERQFLTCPDTYKTTPDFEDPLASRVVAEDEDTRIAMFARLDTYAAGKLLQVIFDPSILDERGRRINYPVVRQTEFMLPGLHVIIEQMTGENNYDPMSDYTFPLTDAQLEERMQNFDDRRTLPQTALALAQLEENWVRTR